MKTRVLALLLLATLVGCSGGGPTTRVRDLRDGVTATVEGRTGQIMERFETPGVKVFTLRDNWGDVAYVRSHDQEYPLMGATYDATGRVSTSGDLVFIDASQLARVHGPVWWPWLVAVIVVVAAGTAISRILSRPAAVWGYLDFVSGAETTTEFPIRGKSVEIGREARGTHPIRFYQLDRSVSRRQGVITRHGSNAYYENLSDKGTVVDSRPLEKNERVLLKPGSVIEMGLNSAIVSFRVLGEAPEATGGRDTETITERTAAAVGEQPTERDSSPVDPQNTDT
jgi:hypothetical protein